MSNSRGTNEYRCILWDGVWLGTIALCVAWILLGLCATLMKPNKREDTRLNYHWSKPQPQMYHPHYQQQQQYQHPRPVQASYYQTLRHPISY